MKYNAILITQTLFFSLLLFTFQTKYSEQNYTILNMIFTVKKIISIIQSYYYVLIMQLCYKKVIYTQLHSCKLKNYFLYTVIKLI